MPPRAARANPQSRHPIQVVARRTGLSADVIRAWEKRYGVVRPSRSDAGRRLYSDADVDRLRLLARATLSGRSIGDVASVTPRALEELVRADDAHGDGVPVVAPLRASRLARAQRVAPLDSASSGTAAPHLATCLRAVERFDLVALETALRRAVVALSAASFLDGVVVPFWQTVIERVRDGGLRRAHEPLALSVLRRALDGVVEAATSPLAPPDLLVATPLGQSHELGALVAAAAAAAEGWRVVYVGPGLSSEAIAELASELEVRAVLLGLGEQPGDRITPRELRRLRESLASDVAILAEGAATEAHRGVLRRIGAVVVPDSTTLRLRLTLLAPRGDD